MGAEMYALSAEPLEPVPLESARMLKQMKTSEVDANVYRITVADARRW